MLTLLPMSLYCVFCDTFAGQRYTAVSGALPLGGLKPKIRRSSSGEKYRRRKGCRFSTALGSSRACASRKVSKMVPVWVHSVLSCQIIYNGEGTYVKFFIHLQNRTCPLYQLCIACPINKETRQCHVNHRHLPRVKQQLLRWDGKTMSKSRPHFSSTRSGIAKARYRASELSSSRKSPRHRIVVI